MKTQSVAPSRKIGIGLMGVGVVGTGVATLLNEKAAFLDAGTGRALNICKALVRDTTKSRPECLPSSIITTDPSDLLLDDGIDIIIEVMGGEEPARSYISEALSRGKHVVTANKEVLGKHGPELSRLAQKQGVALLYEASAGGGIPLISTLQHDLSANEVQGITAIINGTTNYILTRMSNEGIEYGTALDQAMELGYAEPDPSADIEGTDAAHKLALIASLAFHCEVRSADVYCEGISRLAARDFQYARELGYAIKLLAIGKNDGGLIQVGVHPTLIPEDLLLAKVDGVFNAIQIDTDVAGRILLYGRGAGPEPTASAVIADVLRIAKAISVGQGNGWPASASAPKAIKPIEDRESQFYVRMTVDDTYGVMAQITHIFQELRISLASVIQKRSDQESNTAEIVLMTHPAPERAMLGSVEMMENLEAVREIGNVVRVEG